MTGHIQPAGNLSGNNIIRPTGPRPPMAGQSQTITPKEILAILRRHVLLIISFTVLGVIIGGVAWFLLLRYAPVYTALASIEVLHPGQSDPMSFASGASNKDLFYQFRSTKAAFIKQQGNLQELLKRDKVRQTAWFKKFDNDTVKAVEKLKKKMGASAQREGNWILVSMQCDNKKESALIVNEMVDLFIKTQHDMATRDIRAQLAERTKQKQLIKTQLVRAEDSLDTIRKGTEYTNLQRGSSNFQDYLSTKLSSIETNYDDLESQIGRLQATIGTLTRRAEGEYDTVVREQMEEDPISRSIRQTIVNLEISLAQQLTKFGENHRHIKETRDALKQAKNDLASRQTEIADIRRNSNLRNAEDLMTSLTKEIETLSQQRILAKREYKDLDNIRAGYEKIMQVRDEKRDLLEELTKNTEKLNMIFSDPEISKVKKLGNAPEPLTVSFPKMLVMLPAGFILGAMAGLGLAFAIELLNDLIRTPADIRKHLNIPLLGLVCHADEDDNVDQIDLCHVVRQAPYSILSECYRQIRANLKIQNANRLNKVLLITSGGALDGKTSVAVNLTSTLIADDMNVLLIDTNFRNPTTANLFPISHSEHETPEHSDFGLSNYLMGQCHYEQVIRASGINKLDIIDSGPLPANPAEVLGNTRMSELLDKAKHGYDYVIIDGPPMIVSEAKILASDADATILVLNTETTRRGAAQRVVRELRSINVNIAGSVLVGVRILKGGYFHEIFRSYQQYQQMQIAQPV
jgi:polysaccharide biosynthesis transport protein